MSINSKSLPSLHPLRSRGEGGRSQREREREDHEPLSPHHLRDQRFKDFAKQHGWVSTRVSNKLPDWIHHIPAQDHAFGGRDPYGQKVIIIEPYPEHIDETAMDAFAEAAGFEWEYLPAYFWHEWCRAISWRIADPLKFTYWLASQGRSYLAELPPRFHDPELKRVARGQRRRIRAWIDPRYEFRVAELIAAHSAEASGNSIA